MPPSWISDALTLDERCPHLGSPHHQPALPHPPLAHPCPVARMRSICPPTHMHESRCHMTHMYLLPVFTMLVILVMAPTYRSY